jgi:hypothetical protein
MAGGQLASKDDLTNEGIKGQTVNFLFVISAISFQISK